ncbi:MAG: NifU family protein [bacterium]
MSKELKQIRIEAQPSSDGSVCRFTVDQPLYENGSFNCANAKAATGSPLLEALFAIKGVDAAYVTENFLMVAKDTEEDWKSMAAKIGQAIRESIASGKKLISPELNPNKIDPEEIKEKVQKLFEKEINPGIASHGGWVKLEKVEGSKVYIQLGGGCQGCGGASMTLKFGIERSVFQQIPEVTEVIDVTDHTSGENPYYK